MRIELNIYKQYLKIKYSAYQHQNFFTPLDKNVTTYIIFIF